MKKLLLSTVLALGWFAAPIAPAQAQTPQNCGVNFTPQVGINCANVRQYTYSAAILKLVPEATAATDFFCITASPSKRVHINHIEITGTGTAGTQVVYLVHNSVKDTGTTAVAATFGPVPNPLNVLNPAATATTVAYNSTSGNPTGGVSNVATNIRSGIYTVLAANSVGTVPLVWNFGTPDDAYNQRLDLAAGGTDQYCLNYTGATVTAQVLQGFIEWSEE